MDFFTRQGVVSELTAMYTSQQDGISERAIQTVNNIVNCLLRSTSTPAGYWVDVILEVVYIKNRLPTKKTEVATWEIFRSYKPKISHLHVWGSLTYANILPVKGKSSPYVQIGIFVGYYLTMKNYKIYVPD